MALPLESVVSLLEGGAVELLGASGRLAYLLIPTSAFTAPRRGESHLVDKLGPTMAERTGTLSSFRAITPQGIVLFTGTVGTQDTDIIFPRTTVERGSFVAISDLTIRA